MIEAYDLEKVAREIDPKWPCKPIRGIYKSRQRSFSKLTVIDKVDGGKSDALNTGIRLSDSKYVGCIDVDCLLMPDALLHVVKAFYQRSRKRVIAVGGQPHKLVLPVLHHLERPAANHGRVLKLSRGIALGTTGLGLGRQLQLQVLLHGRGHRS